MGLYDWQNGGGAAATVEPATEAAAPLAAAEPAKPPTRPSETSATAITGNGSAGRLAPLAVNLAALRECCCRDCAAWGRWIDPTEAGCAHGVNARTRTGPPWPAGAVHYCLWHRQAGETDGE
jgi:hypothetical protein